MIVRSAGEFNLNRVHGKLDIKRRNSVEEKSDYRKYKNELVEDFKDICGYCGKNRKYFSDKFEIDHFRPQTKYPQFKNDYTNLVLSCSLCNRYKSDDWPTNNPELYHDEQIGYVDPASEEFDQVFYRKDDGNIESDYEYGRYMIEKLKFNIRPIKLIWKLDVLHYTKSLLREKRKSEDISKEELDYLDDINIEIEELTEFLKYDKGE